MPQTSSPPTIAEVLHLAADKHLWDGGDYPPYGKMTPSCHAIERALHTLWREGRLTIPEQLRLHSRIKRGLAALGLSRKNQAYSQFEEFQRGPKRQGARYAWLKFCAMLAEEQGV